MGISWWGMREQTSVDQQSHTTNNQPLTALSPVPGFAIFDFFKLNALHFDVLK